VLPVWHSPPGEAVAVKLNNTIMDHRNVTGLMRFFLAAVLTTFYSVSDAQSLWGFSVASTEYYAADSTHREYCFFSKAVDVTTLDCSKIHTHTILGEERDKGKVGSECLAQWFFAQLKNYPGDAARTITSERMLIGQVERLHEKGKDCSDYDVSCFFANQKEAEKERQAFMKRAKKLNALVFEVE
jgi:hypothetical protein